MSCNAIPAAVASARARGAPVPEVYLRYGMGCDPIPVAEAARRARKVHRPMGLIELERKSAISRARKGYVNFGETAPDRTTARLALRALKRQIERGLPLDPVPELRFFSLEDEAIVEEYTLAAGEPPDWARFEAPATVMGKAAPDNRTIWIRYPMTAARIVMAVAHEAGHCAGMGEDQAWHYGELEARFYAAGGYL